MIALRALCDIEFLDVQDVLAIHSRMISEFGGSPGVKSHEQLESAVQAPRSGYYESYEELARAVLDGIAFGHAFHDGNKRTAIRAMWASPDLPVRRVERVYAATLASKASSA